MRNTSIAKLFWGITSAVAAGGACGELDRIDDGFGVVEALGMEGSNEQPLTITGQVLEAEGRPLWNLGVWLVPEEPGATTTAPDVSSFTWPDGHFDIEAPEPGRYELRFSRSRFDADEPLAVVDIDTRDRREVDVTLERADVMSCRLLDERGEAVSITSYALWTTSSDSGSGVGGGTGGCGGSSSCGPKALTFFWPSGFERVELRLGQGEAFELAGPGDACDATAIDL
jgi:hypothetical protein